MRTIVRNLLQRQAIFEQSVHLVQESNDEDFSLLGTEIADALTKVEALRDLDFIDARLSATGEAARQLKSQLSNMSK